MIFGRFLFVRTNIRPFLRFAAFFLVLALAVALANTCLIQTDTFVALMMDELKNSRDKKKKTKIKKKIKI